MATDAPYYQMCAGQLSTDINSSTATAQADIPQDRDYGLTPITAIKQSAENQHMSLYPGHAARQPGADTQHNDFEESHNLVELLEAATTAADQDPVTMHPGKTTSVVPNSRNKSKRKRGSSPQIVAATPSEVPSQDHESSTMKRRHTDTSSTDPNLQTNDIDTTMCSPASKTSPSPSRDSLLVDARAAGVHSAAALFRRTSSNTTRKYTRPPMSKLFMSLNITPENFIALQALAKAYMLSHAHPERQLCVGNRGKGDTDMVKLRLFNCVRDFLSNGGVGERFFGEHIEKPDERESSEAAAALGEKERGVEKLVWPRDGNKIISLVTPLMRRMVTNERQRLYAIDSRKGGKKAEKEGSVEAHVHQSSPGTPAPDVEQHLQTALDPTLQCPAAIQKTPPPTPTTTTVQAHLSNSTAPSTSNSTALSSPTASLASFPTEAAEPHLTNINIFLTYAPSASKSIKLDEKRISTTRPAHLTFYNYTAFIEQVNSIVNRAELLHPFAKPSQVSADSTSAGTSENESLRGLAAAANALQPDKDEQQPQSATSGSSSATKYVVKTIGPTGWQVIDSAETWYHVLTERAFATWADGVCNVIVELGAGQPQTVVRKASGTHEVIHEGTTEKVQMDDV